jgi:hypothetical protein
VITLTLWGHPIRVHFSKRPLKVNGRRAHGCYIPKRREIWISPNLSPAVRTETLVHEIMHALWHAIGLGPRVAEEKCVTRLTLAILTLLSENPNLLRTLAETKGKPTR